MPVGNKMDPPRYKDKPTGDSGNTSGVMYLEEGKTAAHPPLEERSEKM